MAEKEKNSGTLPAGDSRLLARFSLALALLIPALIAAHPLANNDLPMHLAVGNWIFENGQIPNIDPFSATGHGGPWVAHEWLAATLFKSVESLGHPNFLITLAVLLSASLGGLLELIQRSFGVPAFWRLLLLVPVWLAVGRRLMLRPHLLALNLVLLVWWITRNGRQSPRWLWVLIPVMTLWANMHGSFLLGIAYIIGDLCIFSQGHTLPRKQRFMIAGGSVLATLINPHGAALYLFPFQLALDPVFTAGVFEWLPPWTAPGFMTTPAAISGIGLFSLAVLGSALQGWGSENSGLRGLLKRPGFALSLLAALTATFLASRQLRHLALASLLWAPVIGVLWATLKWRISPSLQKAALAFPIALVLLLGFQGYPAGIDAQGQWRWRSIGSGWSPQTPVIPIDTLVNQWEVSGVLLCEYEFGGFASYISGGKLRPTMDSRNTVYTPEFFLAHESALRGENEELRKTLTEKASAILVHPGKPGRRSLELILKRSPEWALISWSDSANLWVNRAAVPAKYRSVLPK